MTGSRTLLLDLDGTLVNSVPDIRAALNRLMAARGLADFSAAETAAMVGDGVRVLTERAFAARGHVADENAIAAFAADYGAHAAIETRPYPDVPETLTALADAGWRLAVCTNKPEAAARALLKALDLSRFLSAIGGGDSFPVRKPDPAHLIATLAAAGGDPAHAVMAGDHANDVAAARGAGIPCIFAAWGYGRPEMAEGASATASAFRELPMLAARLIVAR